MEQQGRSFFHKGLDSGPGWLSGTKAATLLGLYGIALQAVSVSAASLLYRSPLSCTTMRLAEDCSTEDKFICSAVLPMSQDWLHPNSTFYQPIHTKAPPDQLWLSKQEHIPQIRLQGSHLMEEKAFFREEELSRHPKTHPILHNLISIHELHVLICFHAFTVIISSFSYH